MQEHAERVHVIQTAPPAEMDCVQYEFKRLSAFHDRTVFFARGGRHHHVAGVDGVYIVGGKRSALALFLDGQVIVVLHNDQALQQRAHVLTVLATIRLQGKRDAVRELGQPRRRTCPRTTTVSSPSLNRKRMLDAGIDHACASHLHNRQSQWRRPRHGLARLCDQPRALRQPVHNVLGGLEHLVQARKRNLQSKQYAGLMTMLFVVFQFNNKSKAYDERCSSSTYPGHTIIHNHSS